MTDSTKRESSLNITIVGAGNGGLTAAYMIAQNKHNVLLVDDPKYSTQINAINQNKKIKALQSFNDVSFKHWGEVNNVKTTFDFQKAAEFSKIIIMVCPSFAQEILFEKLLPHLNDEHIIVSLPGNYATLALTEFKNSKGFKNLNPTFVDGISIPYACRIVNPGEIAILGVKEYLSISVFPKKGLDKKIANTLSSIFNLKFNLLANPIVAGLENFNYGGHPLMTVCNIGLLENFDGKFNYYKDCCSTATAAACHIMDKERLSVGEAYGWKLLSELEAVNSLYGTKEKTVYDFNRNSVTHGKLHNAPSSSQHRYITEDVPYLLVPCYELGKKAGLELAVVKSIITLAGAYNNANYFQTGRNLKKMGLDSMSIQQIKEHLKND